MAQHIKNVGTFCSKGHQKLADTPEGVQALQKEMLDSFERLKKEALFQHKVLAVTEAQYAVVLRDKTLLTLEDAQAFITAAFRKPKDTRKAILSLVLQPGRVQAEDLTPAGLMKVLHTEIARERRRNRIWGLKLAASKVQNIYSKMKIDLCFLMVAYGLLSFFGFSTLAFIAACWVGIAVLASCIMEAKAGWKTYQASLEQAWATPAAVFTEHYGLTRPVAPVVLSQGESAITPVDTQQLNPQLRSTPEVSVV